jgi:hypothetical protein
MRSNALAIDVHDSERNGSMKASKLLLIGTAFLLLPSLALAQDAGGT